MDKALAENIRSRWESLKSMREGWPTLWEEIARYVMPRRVPGINGSIQSPNESNEMLLFDSTAVQANLTLANGQLAWMSPLESAWFEFKPGRQEEEEAKRWLNQCTAEARNEMAISNFYTAIHEFYLDRGAFGTACLYVEPGRRSLLNAEVWPIGSYVIDEDENHNIDTVIREFKLSPRQAVQRFGEQYVSEQTRKDAGDPKRAHLKKEYLHAVYPRLEAERDTVKGDDANMPIASVYIEKERPHVCRVSGYPEMPVMVSRYLTWGSNLGSLYGWSPGFAALPEARQVNFLQKMMDALAEKSAFPPILSPEELEGEIDANALGVTYFSRDMAQYLPKEWMTQGRYDIGLERVQERQKAINTAFHVDLFQMFAQLEKQMTAREVAERSQEKLIQFSPTFARLTTELFNPLLERIFGVMLRAGRMGEVPQSFISQGVIDLRIQYSSRIALALRALPSLGYQRTLERLAGITATVAPSALDNFDFDKAERETALSDGMPVEYLRDPLDVQGMRDQRAMQAQQQAQQQAMAGAADAAAKLGQIKPGSPAAESFRQTQPMEAAA
jgi:hypothetical protein